MLRVLFCAVAVAFLTANYCFAFGHHTKVVGTEPVSVPVTTYATETQEVTVKVPVTTYVEKKVQKQVVVPQTGNVEVQKPIYARTVKTIVPYESTRKALRWVDVPTTRYTLAEEQVIVDSPGWGFFGVHKARKAEARALKAAGCK